jgi:hypothetical protein
MSKLKEIGVYKITNIVTNKIYIGSTILSFNKRFAVHKCDLRKNKHHSNKLQNSWNKHGESNFIFEILEICKKEVCLIKEQEYINLYNPHITGYNINPNAFNCSGKIVSQKTKDKISSKLKGIKVGNRASKEGLIQRGLKTRKSIYQYDLDNNFIKEWFGVKELAKTLNLSQGNISMCCLGKRTKTGNFKFSYNKL